MIGCKIFADSFAKKSRCFRSTHVVPIKQLITELSQSVSSVASVAEWWRTLSPVGSIITSTNGLLLRFSRSSSLTLARARSVALACFSTMI